MSREPTFNPSFFWRTDLWLLVNYLFILFLAATQLISCYLLLDHRLSPKKLLMQRLSRSLSRFETQDIKTQPLFNHYLYCYYWSKRVFYLSLFHLSITCWFQRLMLSGIQSMMQRLSRSLSRFETQDIKTQPQFNHYLRSGWCLSFSF